VDFTLLPAYRTLGEVYTKLQMPRQAVDMLNMYTLYYPDDVQALTWLGMGHYALGETDLAYKALNQALSSDSKYLDALLVRGEINLEQSLPNNALADYRQAVRIAPTSYEASMGLIKTYLQKELYRLAYVRLRYTMEMSKSAQQQAEVYFYLAQVYEKQHDLAEAIDAWNKLLALQDEDVSQEWRQAAEEHLGALPTLTPTLRPTWTPYATPTPASTITPMLTPGVSPTPEATATPQGTLTLRLSPTP